MPGNPHNHKNLPVVTGGETDAELQEMIIKLTQKYSACSNRQKCMIRALSGLTFASLDNLVKGFNRDFCLEILNAACACRERDLARAGELVDSSTRN